MERTAPFLLLATLFALLPSAWGANCDGEPLTGLDYAAQDPVKAVGVVGLLLAVALVGIVARRLSSKLAEAQGHVLAAALAGHAFYLVVCELGPTTYSAGQAALWVVGISVALPWLSVVRLAVATIKSGEALDVPNAVRASLAIPVVMLVVFWVAWLFETADLSAAIFAFVAGPAAFSVLLAVSATVVLAQLAQHRGRLSARAGRCVAGAAAMAGFCWALFAAGPTEAYFYLLLIPSAGAVGWIGFSIWSGARRRA